VVARRLLGGDQDAGYGIACRRLSEPCELLPILHLAGSRRDREGDSNSAVLVATGANVEAIEAEFDDFVVTRASAR